MNISLEVDISDDELKALIRFSETCEDGQGYDVPKPVMKSLSVLGLVRRVSADIYETTRLGDALLEKFESNPALPNGWTRMPDGRVKAPDDFVAKAQ